MKKEEIFALSLMGVSIQVGTRDKELWPTAAEGCGMKFSEDGTSVTVLLSEKSHPETLRNLRENKQIAITFCRPINFETAQVKGLVTRMAPLTAEDLQLHQEWKKKVFFEYESIGTSQECLAGHLLQPDIRVECQVTSFFIQTPGSLAGKRI